MKIAVIPARKGSKRIPLKNIKDFNGEPMIKWAIEKAIRSKLFEKVFISSDSQEILDYSESVGSIALPLRNASLSEDNTPTAPVIKQAILDSDVDISELKAVCCIYPCSPFIFISDLIYAYEKMIKEKKNFMYPVTEFSHPIQRAIILDNNVPKFNYPEYELTPTQLLNTYYHDTGQFYFGTPKAWLSNLKMHTDGGAFEIPNWRVVDIDNESDWKRAELIFTVLKAEYPQEL